MSRKAALQAAKAGRLQLRKKPKKERPAPCDDPRRQSIRFTPFGAEYVTRKLHADVKLLAELEQLGVKPRVLRSGDVVVVRRDGDTNFPYFLLRVTSEACVSAGSADDHGDIVEAGVPIVRGNFLTPNILDRAGADSYTLDERTAAITAEQIALDSFSKQPILVPMGDGDHYELATVTHTSIMHRVTSVLV
eukprot:COSAG01_NODE_13348_length_1597_cov_2.817757_2_plen_191_part_00